MKKKFLIFASAATAMIAVPAQAQDTVTANVNAVAGISPVLSLTCNDVNFGVWRVPVRSSGGTTTVTLTVSANNSSGSTTATSGGNTTGVALASGYNVPNAATCTVNGSNNASQTIRSAISSNTGLIFGSSNHNNLNNPSQVAALSADLTLGGTGVVIGSTGSGTFRVTGVLTIPQAITADNYGGYSTRSANMPDESVGNAATVTVTDALVS